MTRESDGNGVARGGGGINQRVSECGLVLIVRHLPIGQEGDKEGGQSSLSYISRRRGGLQGQAEDDLLDADLTRGRPYSAALPQ